MEKRKATRVEACHPVLYFTDIYRRPKVGSTRDLSLGGIRMETPHDLVKGERLEVTIAIRPQAITCRGKAIYVSMPETGKTQAGIQFEGLSEYDELHLRQYLSEVAQQRA